MSNVFNPNRKPFSRRRFADIYEAALQLHRLQRKRLSPLFERQNPHGYQHDVGAADVFLDNFGLLFQEQHANLDELQQYERTIEAMIYGDWNRLKRRVLQCKPWWGQHFNDSRRKANAGEPRSLLRLLDDDGIAFKSWGAGRDEQSVAPGIPDHTWPSNGLLPEDGEFGPRSSDPLRPGGVLFDEPVPAYVEDVRLLPPREATPDLPVRVGMSKQDRSIYASVGRDQGGLGTCAAHAVTMALDVLVRRQQSLGIWKYAAKPVCFSPAWVHCASGHDRAAGRTLSSVIATLGHSLPCSEDAFQYPARPEEAEWVRDTSPWKTAPREARSRTLTERFRLPEVVELPCDRVSRIKAYLAAGWVIVAGTPVTREFLASPGLMEYGLPAVQLPGQRIEGGHGWVLVGYDHVDGNHQWKYQGRFFALSSWGERYPARAVHGSGVFTLPFAMLLAKGAKAYALRFRA